MFEALRKMIIPIIIIVLLFFTAMIFLQWGMGMSSRSDYADSNLAAVINGEEVEWAEYSQIYSNLVQQESQDLDEELPDDKVKELQKQAWSQLLNEKLLMQQVVKHGITVSEREIYEYLRISPPIMVQQHPSFQTNGQFDYQKYMQAMADPKLSGFWAQLEPIVRTDLLKLKMQQQVIDVASVSEEEVREFFLTSREKVKVGMINVAYNRWPKLDKPTEEVMKAFFEEHREDYKIDERAQLSIAMIEKKPAPYDWEVSFARAKAIYDSVAAGGDFADFARRYSEDEGSAIKGGDLDWFRQGRMVDEFDRLAFSMKEGDLSEPFRTKFGWHIIKHHGYRDTETEIRPGEKKTFKEAHASHILIKAAPSQETLSAAYTRLEEFHEAAKKNGFFKAAEDLQMQVKETTPFFRGRNIQYLGNDDAANTFAFENKVDEISDIMENTASFFVLRVSKNYPAGLATFEESAGLVERDCMTDKMATRCHDTAMAIWNDIQQGIDPKKAAENHGDEYTVTEPFDRGAYVPELGRDPRAIGAAFSLTKPGEMTAPVDFKQGCAIFKLIERTSPDVTEFTTQRDSLKTEVLQAKQRDLLGRWFQTLVEDSEIINNVERLNRRSDYY